MTGLLEHYYMYSVDTDGRDAAMDNRTFYFYPVEWIDHHVQFVSNEWHIGSDDDT